MLKPKMEFSQIAMQSTCFPFSANLIVLFYKTKQMKLLKLRFQKQSFEGRQQCFSTMPTHKNHRGGKLKIQIYRAPILNQFKKHLCSQSWEL